MVSEAGLGGVEGAESVYTHAVTASEPTLWASAGIYRKRSVEEVSESSRPSKKPTLGAEDDVTKGTFDPMEIVGRLEKASPTKIMRTPLTGKK